MRPNLNYFQVAVWVGLLFGVGLGGCESKTPKEVTEACQIGAGKGFECDGASDGGCLSCIEDCEQRWHDAREKNDKCAELWLEAVVCVNDLICDDYYRWLFDRDSEESYPCSEEESEFHKQCPGVEL